MTAATTEIKIEPKHPSRLEKKTNMAWKAYLLSKFY